MDYFISDHIKFIFDPLSLFFLAVIAVVSLPSLIFSAGYLKGQFSGRRIILLHSLTAVFILSMAAVVTSADLICFLIAWEIMSLVSFFLVIFEHEHEGSVQAGVIYIVMTHIGTAFLTAAFLLMYQYSHSFDFASVRSACAAMPANVRDPVFIFLLIGFGTKAGIVPLHIWLPFAHPQAPSHISSIMSGVMIKTAVYGMIRFIIYMLGVQTTWWALLILILAIITCFVGIIYALMEHDIKRLLAYSSVENMGIVLLGTGGSMLFISLGQFIPAMLSLVAGLYHLINHAIFKGLLFLGAGSVYKAGGTRNMEKLGGLIKTMPWTAGFFLIGAMAISGLPPLNGFVSEWLTLQSFFLGSMHIDTGGLKLFLGLCAAALAFTSGLAAACFVKAFGITFLAQPRSRQAQEAKEAPASMLAGMAVLAALAVLFGLGAGWVIRVLTVVAGCAVSIDPSTVSFSLNNFILSPAAANRAFLSTPLIAAGLLIFGSGIAAAYLLVNKRGVRFFKTWDCGYYDLSSRNEYTATAFSKPFRVAFSFFLFPYRRTRKIWESFYHVKSFSYETHTTPVFKKYFYDPLLRLIFGSAGLMRRIQPGSIHLYIGYIFLTVVVLILLMRKF
jgi:hydrogenase-4 component B